LSDLNQISIIWTNFLEKLPVSTFKEIRGVGTALLAQTDGWTGMVKLIGTFRAYVNASEINFLNDILHVQYTDHKAEIAL